MGGHTLKSRDYWLDNSQHINVLEAQPLLQSLLSFREHLTSSRVDIHTYDCVLKSTLGNGGCRSSEVSSVLKNIFHSCREYNFSLDVYYVPTGENPADLSSRSRSNRIRSKGRKDTTTASEMVHKCAGGLTKSRRFDSIRRTLNP